MFHGRQEAAIAHHCVVDSDFMNRIGLITCFDDVYQAVLTNIRTPFARMVIEDQIATAMVRGGASFGEARAHVNINRIEDPALRADTYLALFDAFWVEFCTMGRPASPERRPVMGQYTPDIRPVLGEQFSPAYSSRVYNDPTPPPRTLTPTTNKNGEEGTQQFARDSNDAERNQLATNVGASTSGETSSNNIGKFQFISLNVYC